MSLHIKTPCTYLIIWVKVNQNIRNSTYPVCGGAPVRVLTAAKRGQEDDSAAIPR